MTPPNVHVSYDPSRSRFLGMRWMARVGHVGDFGSGRTRAAAIRHALRIYNRDLNRDERTDETITYTEAQRIVYPPGEFYP